jgi:hypothetical protein
MWKSEVAGNDLLVGLLSAHLQPSFAPENDLKINLHFFPSAFYSECINDLQFEKEKMKRLWKEGIQGSVETEEHGQANHIAVRRDVLHNFLHHYPGCAPEHPVEEPIASDTHP